MEKEVFFHKNFPSLYSVSCGEIATVLDVMILTHPQETTVFVVWSHRLVKV